MTENLIFNINVDMLMRAGMSVNQYFMLQLIKNKQAELYVEYRALFANPVNKEDMDSLVEKGYLAVRSSKTGYTFDNLFVTQKFLDLGTIKIDDALEELREAYPKFTPDTKRRLQAKPDKWGPKYLSIIKKDRDLHDKIIKCIKAEAKHRNATKDQNEFWPMLLTYVNNKMWEEYMEEVDNISLEEVSNNYDI